MKKFFKDYWELCKESGRFYKNHWLGIVITYVVMFVAIFFIECKAFGLTLEDFKPTKSYETDEE